MSDTAGTTGHFAPLHAAHAIEQVVFTIQIDRPLSDAKVIEISKLAAQFRTKLPKQDPIQVMTFALGAGGMAVQNPPAGTMLSKIAADGTIEQELRMDRQSLTFRTLTYSRWVQVWADAKSFFEVLLPAYIGDDAKVMAISLSVIDKFVWQGDMAHAKTNLLLQPGSKYLCPNIFEVEDFWHSHTGAFIRVDNQTKRLLNVNADYLDEQRGEEMRRVVAITTVLTDMFNQAGYDATAFNAQDAINAVDSHMQALHILNKQVLDNTIIDTMSQKIALNTVQ